MHKAFEIFKYIYKHESTILIHKKERMWIEMISRIILLGCRGNKPENDWSLSLGRHLTQQSSFCHQGALQSEMTDPRSLWCTYDVIMHVFIITHIIRWHILFLSPNGEKSLNIFSSPDPDRDPDDLRGGPSHGYNTSWVTKSSKSEQCFWVMHPDRQIDKQTYPNALPLHSFLGVSVTLESFLLVVIPTAIHNFTKYCFYKRVPEVLKNKIYKTSIRLATTYGGNVRRYGNVSKTSWTQYKWRWGDGYKENLEKFTSEVLPSRKRHTLGLNIVSSRRKYCHGSNTYSGGLMTM